jgi:hypothetical protein
MGMVGGERERSSRRYYSCFIVFVVASLLTLVMAGLPVRPAAAGTSPVPAPVPDGTSCGTGVTCTPPLIYHGGSGCTNCVQHNPKIYLIFWGSQWTNYPLVASAIIASVGSFAGTALNNVLTQYGDAAGNINNDVQLVDSAVVSDFDPPTGGVVDGSNAPAVIKNALSQHTTAQAGHPVWSNSNDAQFMIVLQPDTYAVPYGGNPSCGFHAYDKPDNFVYSFIDYPGNVGNAPVCKGVAPDRMTWTAFHEYAEAATNPHLANGDAGDGWHTDETGLNILNPMEVADLCDNADSAYHVWPNVWPDPNDSNMLYPSADPGYAQQDTGNIQELYSNEAHGCVYWRGEDGFVPYGYAPHTVSAPMEALYDAYAWNGTPPLPSVPGWGFPTTEQVPVSGGLLQKFTQGTEYYQASTGVTHEVTAPMDAAYATLGGPSSFLGWPTSDLFTAASGIEETTFAGSGCGATGSAIIYDPGVTQQPEEMHGCIYNSYVMNYGGLNGEFGAPTTGEMETPSNDGRMNRMSGTTCGSKKGSALYYDGATYPVKGCFYQTYLGLGETNSLLGYPVNAEYTTSAGVRQDFQRGSMLFTSSGVQVTYTANYYAANVTVLANNTAACPGTSQYFTTSDGNKEPIEWTYANGSQQCINVAWAINSPATSCHYDIYVPDGHATGTIVFTVGALTSAGNPHTYTVQLNENPVSGWQSLTDNTNVYSIRFGDNNGQSYPTELGWGSAQKDGIRQIC